MASYVGVAALGSPSLASWKMKTLSTDLGSKSAEEEKKGERKKEKARREEYLLDGVCLSSLRCPFRPFRPKEME